MPQAIAYYAGYGFGNIQVADDSTRRAIGRAVGCTVSVVLGVFIPSEQFLAGIGEQNGFLY